MLKINICVEKEQIQEMFDENEVKFSNAKMKKLQLLIDQQESDIITELEYKFLEIIGEIIGEEWGE
jgi:hypothetical protein